MRHVRVLLLLLIPLMGAGAQDTGTTIYTIDEALSLIMFNNHDIRTAIQSVETARKNLGSVLTIENSKLSLKGGYSGSAAVSSDEASVPNRQTGGSAEPPVSAQATVSIPVFPILSFSGNVSTAGTGDISVSVKPFERMGVTPAAREALLKAQAKLESVIRETRTKAENVLMSIASKTAETEYARRSMVLKQQTYEAKKNLYEADKASFAELQDASSAHANAVQQYYSAQKAELEAGRSLLTLLGPSVGEISIEKLSIDALLEAVSARMPAVNGRKGASPSSLSVLTLQYELSSLEAELRATPVWKPDLSFSAKVGIPSVNYEFGVSLGFSPSDLKTDERKDLETRISNKRIELSTQQYLLAIDRDLSERNIGISTQSLESARLDLKRTDEFLEETRVLYDYGERTILELTSAELETLKSRNTVFQQAINLLKAQNDFLLLFPE